MIIDAHQHFWNPARGDYGWMESDGAKPLRKCYLPQDFMAIKNQFDIDKTVLVQAAPTIQETEYMLGLADATDFVAKVVGWIDFENRADLKQLERLAKHPKFSGVRPMIQDITDRQWMHRADVQWAYQAIIDLELTFDALGFPQHLDPFLKLFQQFPKMRTVIDHGMKPAIRDGAFASWAAKMETIARETTVFCKLSGLATEAAQGWSIQTLRPYVDHMIESFGADRVMWGSDWPVLTLNGNYRSWYETAQACVEKTTDRQKIFGGSAQKFYRIS
jgi:L-fuconolactonase